MLSGESNLLYAVYMLSKDRGAKTSRTFYLMGIEHHASSREYCLATPVSCSGSGTQSL